MNTAKDLKPGDRVEIYGLVHWGRLNGTKGTVVEAEEMPKLLPGNVPVRWDDEEFRFSLGTAENRVRRVR